jgi:hypothetical protein
MSDSRPNRSDSTATSDADPAGRPSLPGLPGLPSRPPEARSNTPFWPKETP